MSEPKKTKRIYPKEIMDDYEDSDWSEYQEYLDSCDPFKNLQFQNREEALDYWAELQSGFQELDPARVKAIYHKCDETGWVFEMAVGYMTGFDIALFHLEPQEALEMFENEVYLEKLRDGYDSFQYLLRSMDEPYCTLPELTRLTDEFIKFQQKHKDHIIQTGFPKKHFRASIWFDWYLSRLYYVKSPIDHPGISCYSLGSPSFSDSENLSFWKGNDADYYSKWAKKEELSEECLYKESSFFDFIDSDLGKRMDVLREKVFNMRMDILSKIKTALKSEKPDHFWEDCLKLMTENLDFDECQFLLQMDRLFSNKTSDIPFGHPYQHLCHVARNAGLSDIIHVIGHFEKELSIGTISKTKKNLDPILQNGDFKSYYDVVGSLQQNRVDEAVRNYLILRESEEQFNLDFQSRVNEMLENDFEMDIPLTVRGKRGNRYKIVKLAQPHVQSIAAYLDQTGQLPIYKTQFEVLDKEEDCTISKGNDDFKHSPSYHSIKWRETEYTLSQMEAAIVKLLYEAYINETPDVGGDYILETIGSRSRTLKSLLRNTALWNTLVISKKKGSYRLNIP